MNSVLLLHHHEIIPQSCFESEQGWHDPTAQKDCLLLMTWLWELAQSWMMHCFSWKGSHRNLDLRTLSSVISNWQMNTIALNVLDGKLYPTTVFPDCSICHMA